MATFFTVFLATFLATFFAGAFLVPGFFGPSFFGEAFDLAFSATVLALAFFATFRGADFLGLRMVTPVVGRMGLIESASRHAQ
ncbi:MAG TPA: hypothetical protein VFS04_08820 [Alphaproteobacteria bacterium]|nr:hypothetical protein [Alphaproteobacteria bacterium]